MKDFLRQRVEWCGKSIDKYNQYFDSRVASYGFDHLGVVSSFKVLVELNDINSTDFMYYGRYNEYIGQLELIGSLVYKIGD